MNWSIMPILVVINSGVSFGKGLKMVISFTYSGLPTTKYSAPLRLHVTCDRLVKHNMLYIYLCSVFASDSVSESELS
jgi:hypothetical protein